MRVRTAGILALGTALAALVACGGDSDDSTCPAGRQADCTCPGGTTGFQVCADDGDEWGPCQCGTAGFGGAAGFPSTGGFGGVAGTTATGGMGGFAGVAGCAIADGERDYLLSISIKLLRTQPIVAAASVTTAQGQLQAITAQPLLAADRSTPSGPPISMTSATTDPDGSFRAEFGNVLVPGDANPISGSELETTLTLVGGPGSFCPPTDFICGDMEGTSLRPLPLDLSGSTFTMQSVTTPGTYPTPLIDCAGTPADPPR